MSSLAKHRKSSLRAVVLDWAGTVIDFGSLAPMGAFVEVFARYGVEISVTEARGPMGLPKWDHIKALGTVPRIAAAWEFAQGAPFSDEDVDELYDVFTPMNAESVKQHAQLIPGVIEMVGALRARGLAIGSTTGYNRAVMEVMMPLAAAQGFTPDNVVCAGDLSGGRPTPLMMYRTFADLGVWPPDAVLKVDDTAPGIVEGLAAGTWTVGIIASGNGVGLSLAQWNETSELERNALRATAGKALLDAGAHTVIDTVADLLPVITHIETMRAANATPMPFSFSG